MSRPLTEKYILGLLAVALCYPLVKHLLPVMTPFLLGFGLAVAAEGAVKWIHQKLGLCRGVAAGIGVTGVFILSVTVLILLSSLLLRQLGRLSQWVPAITDAISQGSLLLRQWLLSIAQRAPGNVRQVMTQMTQSLFDSSAGLLQQAVEKLPQMAGSALGKLSHGFVGGITAALSAFMISARLPQLRQQLTQKIPGHFSAIGKGFRRALGRWLLAQGKLAGVAFALLWLGFLILKIPQALMWAALVTMVDILPILGVGTALVPWSLVCFLQGNTPKALGLIGIFLVIWLARSVLEPKLVGKELGLDPLVTLVCIYAGFRLWGIWGMLVAPIVAVCVVQLWRQYQANDSASEPYESA